jgi:hypothetical protein
VAEFIQIMRFSADSDIEKMKALDDEYRKETEGKSTYTSDVLGRDLDTGEYVVIVTFPSKEAADKNNELPETQAFAEKSSAVTNGPPSFSNVEVIERNP